MKRILASGLLALTIATTFNSCAVVFGGRITECQRIRPRPGEPQRAVRPVPLIADILCGGIWLIPDFATGAIYRPCIDHHMHRTPYRHGRYN